MILLNDELESPACLIKESIAISNSGSELKTI